MIYQCINEQAQRLQKSFSKHQCCSLDDIKTQDPDQTGSLVLIGHGTPKDIAGLSSKTLTQLLKPYIQKSFEKINQ